MKTSEVAIIGAGVAGLAAARAAAGTGVSTLVFDPMGSGGQLALMTSIHGWPDQPDAPTLAQSLLMDALKAGARLEADEIVGIVPGKPHVLRTASEEYQAAAIVVATGGRPKPLSVEGWETWVGKGISFCAECDGDFFRDEPVVVVAGNPWAAAEALHLSHVASSVHVVTEKSILESVAPMQVELAQCANVRTSCSTQVVALGAGAKGIESLVLRQDDQDRREDVAGVFVCAESLPNIGFIEGQLAQGESSGLLVDAMLRTSVPGIFAAGAVRAGCPNFFVAAAADGTIAGLQAAGYCRAEAA